MNVTNWKREIILIVGLCSILMLMTGLLSFNHGISIIKLVSV